MATKESKKAPPRKWSKRKKITVWLSVLGVLVLFRILLPFVLLRYVNNKLNTLTDYTGHVEDIDLALIAGAFAVDEIKLVKRNTGDTIPFFTCARSTTSIEWKALLKGRLVVKATLKKPFVYFVKEKHKDKDIHADTSDFNDVIKEMMPFTINRFEIQDGEIHYIDYHSNPKVKLAMTDIHVLARNLSNVNDSNAVLPSSFSMQANCYGGNFTLDMRFDPLNKKPTFDMNAELSNLDLIQLNDFLRAYGNFDVKQGWFGLYTEVASKSGKFEGYVKPVLRDVDIVQWNEAEGNVAQKLWETTVASIATVFQNQRKDQLATKIPLKGTFNDPNIGIWGAVVQVLKNAFVEALRPSIDKTINIANVGKAQKVEEEKKVLFKKMFGKKKKDNND